MTTLNSIGLHIVGLISRVCVTVLSLPALHINLAFTPSLTVVHCHSLLELNLSSVQL